MDPTVLNWDPPKVSRAGKIPEEEWEKHRTWICDLHENGSTLDEIMSVMRHHSTQEGTFFEPTRKQYVSRLEKWNLRRYGLHQNTKGVSPVLAPGARQSSGSSEEKVLLAGLQYHQSKCDWCEPASPNCPAILRNVQLAVKHGPLSGEEVCQKLDLADFYLAAKDLNDAWVLYAEVLYRSYRYSDPDRLLIVVKVLYSSMHFNQQKTAKVHLAHLMRTNEGGLKVAGWMMHLLRGMICQTRGNLDLATQHMQRAAKLCKKASKIANLSQLNGAAQELISDIAERLERKKSQVSARLLHHWFLQNGFRITLLTRRSMEPLLQWCLEQVEGDEYYAMLSSSPEKPWTNAPSLQSFKDFENTVLFCYLWQKYRGAQKAQSWGASSKATIVLTVEDLEQSLHIPAPMIFSTVCSMKVVADTASLATEYMAFSLEQMARQAVVNLKRLTTIVWWHEDWEHEYQTNGSLLFFKAYASINSDIEETDEQNQFRKLAQKFVRQFARAEFPRSALALSLEAPEAYTWRTNSMTRIARAADEEKVNNHETEPRQSRSIVWPIRPASPTVVPMPGTLPTHHEANERPASSASVDMLATPRSSLSSSKASLRSFQRVGRAVELLLKRGGSGANQLPSEVMNRDSQSSWSLRRLTGVSYLSATSEMTRDGQTEQDTVVEDAPFQY